MTNSVCALGIMAPRSYLHTMTLELCPNLLATSICFMPLFSLSRLRRAPKDRAKSLECWSVFFPID